MHVSGGMLTAGFEDLRAPGWFNHRKVAYVGLGLGNAEHQDIHLHVPPRFRVGRAKGMESVSWILLQAG